MLFWTIVFLFVGGLVVDLFQAYCQYMLVDLDNESDRDVPGEN